MPCSRSKAGGRDPHVQAPDTLGDALPPSVRFWLPCPARLLTLSWDISNWNQVVAEILLGHPRLRAVGPDGFSPLVLERSQRGRPVCHRSLPTTHSAGSAISLQDPQFWSRKLWPTGQIWRPTIL